MDQPQPDQGRAFAKGRMLNQVKSTVYLFILKLAAWETENENVCITQQFPRGYKLRNEAVCVLIQ